MQGTSRSHESSSTTTALMVARTAAAATATIGAALFARWIHRRQSPTIQSHLQCKCGRIEGHIAAKRQDSIRINCYCSDCREYCKFIASLGGDERSTSDDDDDTREPPSIYSHPYCGKDCSRVVQVCKSDVTITKGETLLKLARKFPPSTNVTPPKREQVYMYRFYARCCHVPLFNTVDFLGFVGVFTDFLDDNAEKYAGPVRMFQEEALLLDAGGSTTRSAQPDEEDISVPDFLWKLVRYLPWRKSGPFDYQQPCVYWGGSTSSN